MHPPARGSHDRMAVIGSGTKTWSGQHQIVLHIGLPVPLRGDIISVFIDLNVKSKIAISGFSPSAIRATDRVADQEKLGNIVSRRLP